MEVEQKEGEKMKFRHELKQEISYIDMLALRQRLKTPGKALRESP